MVSTQNVLQAIHQNACVSQGTKGTHNMDALMLMNAIIIPAEEERFASTSKEDMFANVQRALLAILTLLVVPVFQWPSRNVQRTMIARTI